MVTLKMMKIGNYGSLCDKREQNKQFRRNTLKLMALKTDGKHRTFAPKIIYS